MRISIVVLSAFMLCSSLHAAENDAAKSEKNEKWIQLFNGKDLKDWKIKIRGYELNDNHNNTFRVENGFLKVSYDKYEKFDEKFGHIFYKDSFSHYRLRVEYRFVGDLPVVWMMTCWVGAPSSEVSRTFLSRFSASAEVGMARMMAWTTSRAVRMAARRFMITDSAPVAANMLPVLIEPPDKT